MPARIHLIRHEVVPKTGSYEVRFSDGRESKFFYWDDEPSRRLRPEMATSARALHAARTFAGHERDAIEDQ
jgi:hypothetical protein